MATAAVLVAMLHYQFTIAIASKCKKSVRYTYHMTIVTIVEIESNRNC